MPNGKIEISPTVRPCDHDDLAGAYPSGVADAVHALADDPARADELTNRANSIVVVSDGSAVLDELARAVVAGRRTVLIATT